MKVGDLVRYRGWKNNQGPIGLIIEEASPDSKFHHRIRVMWLGEPLPVQAKVLSVDGKRITSWVSPKHFSEL